VGVGLVLIGAILVSFPLVSQGNQALYIGSVPGADALVENVSGFSITGITPVTVSWTSNNSTYVSVLAAVCQAPCFGSNVHGPVTSENGSSGSFSLNPSNGWGIVLIVSTGQAPVSVTFRFVTAANTVGTCFLVGGGALLVAGIVLWSKRKPPLPP
jgi:hypothetical protein